MRKLIRAKSWRCSHARSTVPANGASEESDRLIPIVGESDGAELHEDVRRLRSRQFPTVSRIIPSRVTRGSRPAERTARRRCSGARGCLPARRPRAAPDCTGSAGTRFFDDGLRLRHAPPCLSRTARQDVNAGTCRIGSGQFVLGSNKESDPCGRLSSAPRFPWMASCKRPEPSNDPHHYHL